MVKKRGAEGKEEKAENSPKKYELEEKLIENLVELQKVHTSMAEKFDKLSEQITNLLTLFESAARSFAEHPSNQVAEKDKEFLEKVDKLLEQNKTIAKGLTIVEERIRERVYGPNPSPQPQPRPMAPTASMPAQMSSVNMMPEEKTPEEIYVPSVTTKPLPRF